SSHLLFCLCLSFPPHLLLISPLPLPSSVLRFSPDILIFLSSPSLPSTLSPSPLPCPPPPLILCPLLLSPPHLASLLFSPPPLVSPPPPPPLFLSSSPVFLP